MIRFISIICTFVIVSLFFFPFQFKFLPGVNTKVVLAAMGLVVFILKLARDRKGAFNKDMFVLTIFAALVSLAGLTSVTINSTPDYAYTTYLVSMLVWVGAAYFAVCCIRRTHGCASVLLVGNYLIAVCVFQCVMALWIDASVSLKTLVDAYIEQGQDFLNSYKVQRLYGIGASLDVAGSRFAAVLALTAFFLIHIQDTVYRKYQWLYWIAFIIIAVAGNMVARTTTVGVLVAFLYLLYKSKVYLLQLPRPFRYTLLWFFFLLVIAVPVLTYYYNHNADFQKNLHFAFEGFFSLAEEGKWDVSSNEKLKTMYVFPDNWKTWFIGDGYFDNPVDTDPYFTGKVIQGFYMGTDVGYLRFIFYFGLVGLAAFSAFIYKSFLICWKRFVSQREMFLLFLLINFIIWFKVSTDIFLVFALFLMVSEQENKTYNERILITE